MNMKPHGEDLTMKSGGSKGPGIHHCHILHFRVIRKSRVLPLLVLHMLEFYTQGTHRFLRAFWACPRWLEGYPCHRCEDHGYADGSDHAVPCTEQSGAPKEGCCQGLSGTQITAELGTEPFRDIE